METSKQPECESLLIRQACAGSRTAFAELAGRCTRKIYGLSLRMLRNRADAEDNVQNTLCKAFTKMDQFKGESRFSTWIISIAINEALMAIRKHRSSPEYIGARVPDTADSTELPFEPIEKKANPEREYSAKELTGKALEQLPDLLRNDFMLHQLEGWTHGELAARRKISAQTMKARMFRARSILARRLPILMAAHGRTSEAPGV